MFPLAPIAVVNTKIETESVKTDETDDVSRDLGSPKKFTLPSLNSLVLSGVLK